MPTMGHPGTGEIWRWHRWPVCGSSVVQVARRGPWDEISALLSTGHPVPHTFPSLLGEARALTWVL